MVAWTGVAEYAHKLWHLFQDNMELAFEALGELFPIASENMNFRPNLSEN